MKAFILIVDTDPVTESLVTNSVDAALCEIEMVSDTSAAMEFLETEDVSIVVVNADLPKGWRFCTELKKKENLTDVPLVLVSSTASEEVFLEHQRLPTRADAYFTKPLDLNTLRMAFLALLNGEQPPEFDVDMKMDVVEVTDIRLGEKAAALSASVAAASSDAPARPQRAPAPTPPETPQAPPSRKSRRTSAPQAARRASFPPEELPPPPRPASPPASTLVDDGEDPELSMLLMEQVEQLEAELEQERKRVALLTRKLKANLIKQRSGDATAPGQAVAMQRKISELTTTATSLREAHGAQSQELADMSHHLDAAVVEVEALQEALNYKNQEIEQLSQANQTRASGEVGALEDQVAALTDAYNALAHQAQMNDMSLREALGVYQDRIARFDVLRDEEGGLTDAVLQVVDHVYQSLELLRRDISDGVPDVPQQEALPPLEVLVPPPLQIPDLPSYVAPPADAAAYAPPIEVDELPEPPAPPAPEEVSDAEIEAEIEALDGDDYALTDEELDALSDSDIALGANPDLLDDELSAELSSLGIDLDRNPGGELPYAND